jgi:uncharacterized repeat protein (TIGR03803 family)
MSRIRSALALCALSLCVSTALAQSATPAVSTVAAFSFSNPAGNLVLGGDGALYGVVAPATSVAGGLVFRAAADGSEIATLYQLSPENDGITPQAGLTLGSDGMLYGTTKFGRFGEPTATGTIFKVSTTGTGFTVLHRFQNYTGTNANLAPKNDEGAYPEAELVDDTDSLYGVTTAGGENGTGAVFKVAKDGANFQVLHEFAADTDTTTSGLVVTTDGAAPVGQLVLAGGFLYGTTSAGGTNGRGTIFRVGVDGTGFVVLKHFDATTVDSTTNLLENDGGAVPIAGLVDGTDGYLYGVTSVGGASGNGVVFSIDTNGTYTLLYTFDGKTGQRPAAELMLGSDGRLYGTTSSGGETSAGAASTLGTIFSIARAGNDPTATNFTRLHSFDGEVGTVPSSKLVQLAANVFAGTLQGGGECGYGAIYRYSGAGDTVDGNTRCGRRNNNNNGGGASGPGLVLMLGTLLWLRRRIAAD